jgi:hypothetical protein
MLTDNDKLRAIKISQALQDFFDKNPITKVLRSTHAYDELLKKNLVEKDRHDGVKFRNFLRKLLDHSALDLIPQLRIDQQNDKWINWYFESAASKTIKARNLRPILKTTAEKHIDKQAIVERLSNLRKRDESDFGFAEVQTRKNYPRAYEYWTKEEDELLLMAVEEITDSFELSKLFGRQPSAIQTRLKEKFGKAF